MGQCLSICQRDEDNINDDEYFEGNNDNKTPSRTKKKKTRIPKNVVIDEDDDEDIPITKHISFTNEENELKSNNSLLQNLQKETPEIKEKIAKAKKNWEYLKDKLIQKRINILREMVKKQKKKMIAMMKKTKKLKILLKKKIIFNPINQTTKFVNH